MIATLYFMLSLSKGLVLSFFVFFLLLNQKEAKPNEVSS
jgi:hypothetical protein